MSNAERLSLTMFVNERVAELIQIGFSSAAEHFVEGGAPCPMTIIEKRGDAYYRIPGRIIPEWTPYCRHIREYRDSDGRGPGEESCRCCDICHAEQYLSGNRTTPGWYVCHAGLVDISIPITFDGRTVAVLFGGQKRLKDDPEYESLVRQRIEALSARIPGLKRRRLLQLVKKVPALTSDQVEKLQSDMARVASYIGDVARRSYEAVKTIETMAHISEHYLRGHLPLQEVLHEAFREIAAFTSASSILLFRRRPEGPLVAFPVDRARDTDTQEFSETVLSTLETMRLSDMDAGVFSWETEGRKLASIIAEGSSVCREGPAFLKSTNFALSGRGLFVFDGIDGPLAEGGREDFINQRREFFRDLSERLRSQIDMYDSDTERDTLVAEVTHRLKSPMQWLEAEASTMVERIRRLAKWTAVDPEIFQAASALEEILDFMGSQTANYAIVATLEQGVAYDIRPHPLGRLVERCAARYRRLAESRGVRIDVRLSQELYQRIPFDWDHVEIVMNNLLDNAVKYSHRNQVIRIRGRLVSGRHAHVVTISSFGVGIAEGERDAIFEKFRRGMTMRDPRRFIPGTGIGLTVARKIAQDHGGDVRLADCRRGPAEGDGGCPEEGWKVDFELILPTSALES